MDANEIKRLFSEELLDGSEYTGFGIGHSVSSIDSTARTGNVSYYMASIVEEVDDEVDYDDYVQMTGVAMLKMVLVVSMTLASVAFYAVSFADMFVIETSVASLSVLGVAGGISVLVAPWVCFKEWRLARYPSEYRFHTCSSFLEASYLTS